METKKKVGLAVTIIILVLIVVAAVIVVLFFGMKKVDSGYYGLRYKKGEDVLLDSNKTFTSGYKWVGFNKKFHQLEDREYEHELRLSGVAKDKSYVGYLIRGSATFRKDELYLTWYSLLGTPKAEVVNPVIQELFQPFVAELSERYFDGTSQEVIQRDCRNFVTEAYSNGTHMDFVVKNCTWEVIGS